jgi:hypothetical protein
MGDLERREVREDEDAARQMPAKYFKPEGSDDDEESAKGHKRR